MVMCKVASKVKEGTIVEIGRYKGGSLLLMSIASPASKIYSIDIAEKFNRASLKLLKKFQVPSDRYNIITGDSVDVSAKWNKDVDLLFIDGDHTTAGVYRDLVAWISHVKIGGTILIHDYFPPICVKRKEVGPYDAITKYLNEYNNMEIERVVQKTCILRRRRWELI